MLNSKTILYVVLLLSACIDPLDVRLPTFKAQLIVDGGISDGPGPHQVRLFYSSNLATRNEFSTLSALVNAEVSILSSDEETVLLSEVVDGVYQTSEGSLIAEPGKTYQLIVRTNDQEEYHSVPHEMEAAGEIDALYYEFVKDHLYNPDSKQFQDALLIYIDSHADASGSGLLRWRYTGTFEIITQPELRSRIVPIPTSVPVRVPDPVPCSGYVATVDATSNPASILQTEYGPILRVDDCFCCSCWVNENDGLVKLAKNQFVQNKSFNKVKIATIPIDNWRFYKKYSIEVEQLSLSEDVYEFWKRVEAQQLGANSLFQPNAVIIKGNMINSNDASDEVLGIFSVSALRKKRISIDREDIPAIIGNPDLYFDDCRLKFPKSSNERPLFW